MAETQRMGPLMAAIERGRKEGLQLSEEDKDTIRSQFKEDLIQAGMDPELARRTADGVLRRETRSQSVE